MPRPITITGPVSPDSEQKLAVRVEFKGADQAGFFRFRKIAKTDFDTDATRLARLLILDFEKEHKENPHSARSRRLTQLALEFGDGKKVSAIVAGKKGGSSRKVAK